MDFHAGTVTRTHGDLDLAIWLDDLERVAALLARGGWEQAPDRAEPGSTLFVRDGTHVEFAFLERDDARSEPYTTIGEGRRAAWAAGAFGDDMRTLEGVRARVIALPALREEKTGPREDPAAEAKDRADRATLDRIVLRP